jgi:cytochrome P450
MLMTANLRLSQTEVMIYQWAINYDPNFWTEPEIFDPARFLHEEKYKDDKLEAMQIFSYGPRNCIGKK